MVADDNNNRMDPEYIINRDDIGTSSSLSSPLLSIRGGGGDEQQDNEISQHENSEFETAVTNSTRCSYCYVRLHTIPTLVYILVPMILIFIAMFLAAAFIPPHHTVY